MCVRDTPRTHRYWAIETFSPSEALAEDMSPALVSTDRRTRRERMRSREAKERSGQRARNEDSSNQHKAGYEDVMTGVVIRETRP
jgi:hypothetical protein